MKNLILILLFLVFSSVACAEVTQEPETFNVRFEVNYNTATLQEAADLEKRIREQHKEACWVKTEVTETGSISSNILGFHAYSGDVVLSH